MKKRIFSFMLVLVLLTACAKGGGRTGADSSGTEVFGSSESVEQKAEGTVTVKHTALVEAQKN